MRNGRRANLLTVVVTCTVLLSGCGQERSEISDQVARTLQRDVVAVKSAVDESRWEEARTALDRLEADVADADASGNLSDDRAAQIQTIRQRVLADLDRIQESEPAQRSATPGAESTPSPEPKLTESAEPDEDDNRSGEEDKGKDDGGQKKGKGEGKGHGKS